MNFCPYCGKDTGGFTRCPHCGVDLANAAGPAATAGTAPTAPGNSEWGKTTVMESAPHFDSKRKARFDQGREFYMPIDETRTGSGGGAFGASETVVAGQTTVGASGDETVVERHRPVESDDATVIVRSGGRRGATGPLAYLVERSGVRAGKVHLLRRETSIGRSTDNDITLGDDSVSRHHARIRIEDGAFVFWDLASANYSFLVGADGSRTRILEPRRLEDGDKLDLGQARVSFLLVDGEGVEADEP